MTTNQAKQEENDKLNAINGLAREIVSLSLSPDFEGAEKRFHELKALVAEANFTDERKRKFSRFLYNDCLGRHWAFRAFHAFTAEVDAINSNTYSLRAIEYLKDSVAIIQTLDLGDSPEIDEEERNMLAFQQAQLDDALGMRDLSAGEVQLRSGQFERAKGSLTSALECLTKAEAAFAADSKRQDERPTPGFSDIAKAMLEETNSEIALIGGLLEDAAVAEKERATALESATRKHAISDLSTSDYFARRLKYDSEYAHDRSRIFQNAAKLQERRPWFASYIFFLFAIGSAVLLVYVMGSFSLIGSPFAIALIFVFVFVVAGVATRLGKWSEGAELLTSLARSAKSTETPVAGQSSQSD